MTVASYLRQKTAELTGAGIASARLDMLILLEDATGKDRSWLLAHPEHELDDTAIGLLDAKIGRRATHIPLAYIRQRTEFYGRTFYVDEHVLEPRPESETMISLLKDLALPAGATIIDVGTGSGALAITAALEIPNLTVLGTDIDPACLAVAKQNNERLGADVEFVETDLLGSKTGPLPAADVILANLPYVPDGWQINQAAMSEPRLAIFGGPDGMDLFRRMFAQIGRMKHKPAYILTESLPPHHGSLAQIAGGQAYVQHEEQDFIQLFRLSVTA